jgi:hypothetical protein
LFLAERERSFYFFIGLPGEPLDTWGTEGRGRRFLTEVSKPVLPMNASARGPEIMQRHYRWDAKGSCYGDNGVRQQVPMMDVHDVRTDQFCILEK